MNTTWADGYGIWHARVLSTPNARRLARELILSELYQRENNIARKRVKVERYAHMDGDAFEYYKERCLEDE